VPEYEQRHASSVSPRCLRSESEAVRYGPCCGSKERGRVSGKEAFQARNPIATRANTGIPGIPEDVRNPAIGSRTDDPEFVKVLDAVPAGVIMQLDR